MVPILFQANNWRTLMSKFFTRNTPDVRKNKLINIQKMFVVLLEYH